jgi:DNA-binding NtrC family response regulator
MNHVLIVDDEADIRESLEAILREEDYAITTAGTAAEALELLRDADYAAVLLDIWLPDGDGLEVLKKIPRKTALTRAHAAGSAQRHSGAPAPRREQGIRAATARHASRHRPVRAH